MALFRKSVDDGTWRSMAVDAYDAMWLNAQRFENLRDVTPDALGRASRRAIQDEVDRNAIARAELPKHLQLLKSLPSPTSAEACHAERELRASVKDYVDAAKYESIWWQELADAARHPATAARQAIARSMFEQLSEKGYEHLNAAAGFFERGIPLGERKSGIYRSNNWQWPGAYRNDRCEFMPEGALHPCNADGVRVFTRSTSPNTDRGFLLCRAHALSFLRERNPSFRDSDLDNLPT